MIVVSFFAPRQAMWNNCDYDALLGVLDASCKRLGLRHVCLSDSKRPNCETFICKDLPRNLMQAFLEAQAQWLEQATEPTLFTGADCVLTRDPRDVLGAADDLVITLGPFADCPMNSGAIWVRNGPEASHVWRAALASNPTKWGEDQTSLYAAIRTCKLKIRSVSCKEHNWAPEHPSDRAGMPTVVHFRGNRKSWMPHWYEAFVVRGLPELVYSNAANTEAETIIDHMRQAAQRDLPWFYGLKPHEASLVIVGGAPSLKDTLDDIKVRQRKGAHVWAMNNAWRPLMAAKIKPDVIVMMDARPQNAEFVKDGPDCHYLIAAMCHPEVFNALEGKGITVWFPDHGLGPERDIISGSDKPTLLVGGGGTVALRSLILGYIAGFREFHLYGVDSSFTGEAHHAYPQALNDGDQRYKTFALGKEYVCAGWMMRQANEFQNDRQKLIARGCRIFAHGSGLIPDVSRHLNQQDRRANASRYKSASQRGPTAQGAHAARAG